MYAAVLSLTAFGQQLDLGSPADLDLELARVGAMNTTGLPTQLASTLNGYYRASFGSETIWRSVQSMRFEGRLELASGQKLEFLAYSKKPNLCKVVIMRPGSDARMVMAYDGVEAWQSMPQAGGIEVVGAMPEAEASNFISDAWFGGHLMYPNLQGKLMEQTPIRREDGVAMRDVTVHLAGQPSVTYVLKVDGYYEVARKRVNAVNGETEVIEQSDFREISGVRVPFHSRLVSDGERVHDVYLTEVKVNQGVPSWVFERP